MNAAGDSPGGAAGNDGGMGGEAGAIAVWAVDPELKKLSPLPALPADPTNKYADDAAAAALGQRLFFDKRYSGALTVAGDLGEIGDTGKVACSTCHLGGAMSDGRAPFNVTVGTGITLATRPRWSTARSTNGPTGPGASPRNGSCRWRWPRTRVTMNSTRLKLAHFIYDNYKAPYEAVFGSLPAALDASCRRRGTLPGHGQARRARPGTPTHDGCATRRPST